MDTWFDILKVSKLRIDILVSLAVICLAGCTSNESITMISEYAKQSTQVQEALMGVYESADEARINAELAKATRDGITETGLNISTIENTGQEALLQNLQIFSQSIYLLATEDRNEELDKYSEKLNSSLISLSKIPQSNNIDSKDIELLSTSANALARAYTEKIRYDLLKKVIIDSETIIQISFKSLRDELGSWKEATKVSLEKELRIRLYLLNNPNRCDESEDKRCVTFYHSLEERINAYKKAYEIKAKLNGLNAKFLKLESALNAIQTLNQSIVISLKSDDDLTKDAFKKALKSTKTQIDDIKEFRDRIKD
ncbi:hypothetical protein Q4Q49_03560 [Shewanella sp. SP1S1-7]|uniref:hypothetical protein n=1 Tax=Shewanella TaxID=22 RepID=UPI00288EE2A3|nr:MULTISPECIES: hypothetical protein [unclassified Shewanella]MDT3294772.1 hypothetical protein [Shewanella sp. SP2S2-6]MDT3307674.1 hypothetical protein [Shewanella sp. SP1S1-4]MDT3334361.1 hypothetical protein [Shewanella sp. SP1S1-7]